MFKTQAAHSVELLPHNGALPEFRVQASACSVFGHNAWVYRITNILPRWGRGMAALVSTNMLPRWGRAGSPSMLSRNTSTQDTDSADFCLLQPTWYQGAVGLKPT